MQRIIAQSKALDSEMKLLAERYKDNADAEEAVIAKSKLLSDQITKQNEKVELIKTEYDRATSSVDDYAKVTEESIVAHKEAKASLEKLERQLAASKLAFGENAEETEKLQKEYQKAEEQTIRLAAAAAKNISAQAKAEARAADLNRQLVDAETYSQKYEKQLAKLTDTTEEFEETVEDTTTEQKELGRELENLADNMEDLGDAAEESGSTLKDVFTAGALLEGLKGIAGAIGQAAEETKEYRKIMASLEVSSQKAGYTAEQTTASYRTLYGVLGDDQTAATTTANLQALGLAQEDLQRLINGTVGAWAKYGDSIPIDGLAEAINHTAQLGEVQGTFADVIEWNGGTVESFNAKLAGCSTTAERANLIMQELARQGLTEAGEAWQQNNKDIVDANLNTARWQENLAQIAERTAPLFNEITSGLLDVVDAGMDLTEGLDFKPLLTGLAAVAGIAGTYSATQKAIELATTAQHAFNAAVAAANTLTPVGLGITALTAAGVGLAALWKMLDEASLHLNEYTEQALEAYDASAQMAEGAAAEAAAYWEMVAAWDAQGAASADNTARRNELEQRLQNNLQTYNQALTRQMQLQQKIAAIQAEMDAGIMGENIDKLKIANDELEEVENTIAALSPVVEDAGRRMDALAGSVSTEYISASERRRQAILAEARESTEAFNAIYGTASNLFSRLNVESELSVADMIENLRANQTALENWAANLQELARRGVDQGLIAELQRLGPEGAKYVAELVTATDEELAELSSLWANAGTTATNALIGSIEAKTPAVRAGVQSLVAAANPNISSFYTVGTNIAQGMIDGMDDWTAAVARASARLAGAAVAAARGQLEIYSPSHVFRDEIVRDGIVAAYITGMDKGQKDVAAHSALLAQSAVDGAAGVRFEGHSFAPYTMPTSMTAGGSSTTNNNSTFNVVVNAAEGQNAEEIADEVMLRLQYNVEREEAVWQ